MYLLLNARLFTHIPANFLQTKALTKVERIKAFERFAM